ncbi:hypothetical protein ACFL2V_03075 [Pseudomonadota bacterium]
MTNGEVQTAKPLKLFEEERVEGVKYLCVKEVEAFGALRKLMNTCIKRMKELEKADPKGYPKRSEYIMLVYREKVLNLLAKNLKVEVNARRVGRKLEFGNAEVSSGLLDMAICDVMYDIRAAKIIE